MLFGSRISWWRKEAGAVPQEWFLALALLPIFSCSPRGTPAVIKFDWEYHGNFIVQADLVTAKVTAAVGNSTSPVPGAWQPPLPIPMNPRAAESDISLSIDRACVLIEQSELEVHRYPASLSVIELQKVHY